MKNPVLLIRVGSTVFILAILVAYTLLTGGYSRVSPRGRCFVQLTGIYAGLNHFASAHEGRMPPLLWQAPDNPSQYFQQLRFRDQDSNRDYDWLYFPRPNLAELTSTTILVASPATIDSKGAESHRVILARDGSIDFISEEQFQKRLSEQFKLP